MLVVCELFISCRARCLCLRSNGVADAAVCADGLAARTFSVWGSVGGCLWPQHALSLQHLSQERINIVDSVAAALGALAAAAAAEEGP